MKPKTTRAGLVAGALLLTALPLLQGCFPVVAAGVTTSALATFDRRSYGVQTDDEGIEWKANKWVADRLGDKVHLNATAFNRKLLLTGEAFNEESREEAGRIAATVETVREVVNELRVAPTSSLSARANDSYISSKVKARFVDQKDFHIQQVKVVTEAGTTYLMGLVTEREGTAATEIARTTKGVQKVVRVFEYISEEEARRLDGAATTK